MSLAMATPAPHSWLEDLDPRGVEDALAREVAIAAASAGANAALVLLRPRAREVLYVRAPRGLDARTVLAAGIHATGGTALSTRALADMRPIVTSTQVEPTDALATVFGEAGFRAWAVVPLELGGIVAGTLHLLGRADALKARPDELVRLVRPVAALASALRCVEVVLAAESRSEVVSRFARGVLAQVEIDRLFPELIRLVSLLCPCDAASVAIRREDQQAFELVAVFGTATPKIAVGTVVPESETPMSVAFRGETVLDGDLARSPYPRSRLLAASGVASAIYVPVGEPERRGVLCIGRSRPNAFTEEDVELYQALVPYLELALRNAELIARMRVAYRELQETQERLVVGERLRALGEMAAGVAHEIGNALAVVGSHAELLGRKVQDPELSHLVSACRASVALADRSVARVLELARATPTPPDGGSESRRARVDLVATEALALVRTRLGPTSHAVDASGLAPTPEAAVAPQDLLEALVHLIRNAFEAHPRGGKVTLATHLEQDVVVLSVDDDGPGVPPDRRERVFEPFSSTKGHGHAGLGLASVARLARRVGGTVRVLTSPLGGARFELGIPCQELGSGPHELPGHGAPPEITPPTPPGASPRPPEARRISVLLVEDEPALRLALPQLLRLRGLDVAAVADVVSAIAELEARPGIEVLVTDLGLPGRSGWDLVDVARTRFPEIAIVVLSGWGALTDPSHARERGVSAVLAKPTSEKELAETITTVAAERRRTASTGPHS